MKRAAAVWLSAIVLCGCDADKGRRGHALEGTTEPTVAEIQVWLSRTRSLRVASVTCPPSVPVEKGYAFVCTASAEDGSTAEVMVEFVDASGVTKMSLRHGIVVATEVERAIAGDAGGAKVDCGKRIRPAKLGATFRCRVGRDEVIEATVANAQGGVSFRPVGP